MLHGFQACSLTYYRLIPLIKDKFIVICPDLIGMGLSSRPKIKFKSTEECINFFVESLEKFRQTLNIMTTIQSTYLPTIHVCHVRS